MNDLSHSKEAKTSGAAFELASYTVTREPHPLDFDWRFTIDTASRINALISPNSRSLLIGAPTVAITCDLAGQNVMLIDRQPQIGVRHHICLDIYETPTRRRNFVSALIDPPWYFDDFRYWISWAANTLDKHGMLFTSMWPDTARPTAKDEKESLFSWIRNWATIEKVDVKLKYECPLFEKISKTKCESSGFESSPGTGDLYLIEPHNSPEQPALLKSPVRWHRFVFNNYQLALRENNHTPTPISVTPHPLATGWYWPSVSRRAPGRECIDLWSSRNEVAVVSGASELLNALHELVLNPTIEQFDMLIRIAPALTAWEIPIPPYFEVRQWAHQ